MTEEVQSPCVLICELGYDGYCKGCFRTSDEIADWLSMSNEEKREVLAAIEERKRTFYK